MRVIPSFVVSLFLTTLISFAAPGLSIGLVFGSLLILGYIPGLQILGQTGAIQILDFLSVFGNGSPWEGVIILGFAGAVVGFFFDIFNFYRYQSLRS